MEDKVYRVRRRRLLENKNPERVQVTCYFEKESYELLKQALLLSGSINRVVFIENAVVEKSKEVLRTRKRTAEK